MTKKRITKALIFIDLKMSLYNNTQMPNDKYMEKYAAWCIKENL